MPNEGRSDDVEKFLNEQKSLEDRKQALIADLLKQKEAAMKEFDDKLAKIGYHPDGKQKRTHHKRSATPAGGAEALPKGKAKA
jgi:hypothetical protein